MKTREEIQIRIVQLSQQRHSLKYGYGGQRGTSAVQRSAQFNALTTKIDALKWALGDLED